mmetsp:Transcript_3165/g.10571  ORF Transcript_3165/g.10571 Transcript_3165/m.10571 type:complete len:171 (-) Transcript_3165:50-562(-)
MHYEQLAWQQQVDAEIRMKIRHDRWQRGGRSAFEEHQVSPLCDFRRTVSQPTFVRLDDGIAGQLPKLGTASPPGAAASRGKRRTPLPLPGGSPAASAPRSSSSSALRSSESRGRDRGRPPSTGSPSRCVGADTAGELAGILRRCAEEERCAIRAARRSLQAMWQETASKV